MSKRLGSNKSPILQQQKQKKQQSKQPLQPIKPLHTDDEDSIMGASPTGSSAGSNANININTNELGILVAVRIRPFISRELETEEEIKRKERHNNNNNNNNKLQRALNEKKKNISEPLKQLQLPDPTLDVEADGKSVVLLDPNNQTISRTRFTFDHVISPLAPSVEIDTNSHISNTVNDQLKDISSDSISFIKDVESEVHIKNIHNNNNNNNNNNKNISRAELEQKQIFEILGIPVVDWSLRGCNACIFAYGQTGSGKTYTMMGNNKYEGIIPRVCRFLFTRITEQAEFDQQRREFRHQHNQNMQKSNEEYLSNNISSPNNNIISQSKNSEVLNKLGPSPTSIHAPNARLTKVTISFMEIYNERVRDLLKPNKEKNGMPHYNSRFDSESIDEYEALKVRQHPLHGPFVEGLTNISVNNWEECACYIKYGNTKRAQANTNLNENSSRSHAIFQMIVTQTVSLGGRVRGKEVTTHRISKINLVDLAGSERNTPSNIKNKQFTEANAINMSLSVLRRVINALVTRSPVIPYRESLLTYILSDNFGGNSKTIMCANISPHISKYNETESTLRYAALTRGIINRVKVNEHPLAKVIRELKERMKCLQEALHRQPNCEQITQLQAKIERRASALAELKQREEELMSVVQESKLRERELLKSLQKKQNEEEMWRREACRQKEEKEKLITALKDLAQQKPELVAAGVIKFPSEEKEENNNNNENNNKPITSLSSTIKGSTSKLPSFMNQHQQELQLQLKQLQQSQSNTESPSQRRLIPISPIIRGSGNSNNNNNMNSNKSNGSVSSPSVNGISTNVSGRKGSKTSTQVSSPLLFPTSEKQQKQQEEYKKEKEGNSGSCTARSLSGLPRIPGTTQPLSLKPINNNNNNNNNNKMHRPTPLHAPDLLLEGFPQPTLIITKRTSYGSGNLVRKNSEDGEAGISVPTTPQEKGCAS